MFFILTFLSTFFTNFLNNIFYFFGREKKITFREADINDSSKKTNDSSKKASDASEEKTNDNTIILEKLGYFNFNINDVKTNFTIETMNYLLYCDNPNYIKNMYLVSYVSEDKMNTLYKDFNKLCCNNKKNKFDFTVNEIIKFIKNSSVYRNLENELNYKFKRAVLLSKYTNENISKNLIEALTFVELNTLTQQN